MRRAIALSAVLALVALAAVPASSAAAAPATTRHVFVECFAGMVGPGSGSSTGRVEHASGILVWDTYFYDEEAGWFLAGTDTNPSWDILNTVNGVEVFRGQFNFSSDIVGDFAGSFVTKTDASGFHSVSVGRSTDGAGELWRATIGVVDPSPYAPLPACAAEQEVTTLSVVELTAP